MNNELHLKTFILRFHLCLISQELEAGLCVPVVERGGEKGIAFLQDANPLGGKLVWALERGLHMH